MPDRKAHHVTGKQRPSDAESIRHILHPASNNLGEGELQHSFGTYDPAAQESVGIVTNRVPVLITPEDIPTARLLIRRDRNTHFQEIGEALLRLHKTGRATDCTVLCNKIKYPAHRIVLAGHSRYFAEFLYSKTAADGMVIDVPADGVQPRALEILLEYFYTAKLNVTLDTVMDVLHTARSLVVGGNVVETCGNFLEVLLGEENLMSTLELAEKKNLNFLYKEAYRKLVKHFYTQTGMPGFLAWKIAKTELHVFTAAMRWIGHSRAPRLKHLKCLMDTVRWMYMTQGEILQCVDQERELLTNEEVRPGLIKATWYKTFKSFDFAWKDYPLPPPRIRSLRDEDPNKVVQRIRTHLQSRRSSSDHI